MKKSLVLGILGLATAAVTTYGQGVITLDNYTTFGGAGGPLITYAPNTPADGVSGALGSGGLSSAWTAGLYYAVGALSLTDPASSLLPIASLNLVASGGSTSGSTAQFDTVLVNNQAGYFLSQYGFATAQAAGGVITAELVVYPTVFGSYAAATTWRGHSAPFQITTVAATSPIPSLVGDAMGSGGGFTPSAVPEPTTLAFGGLGGLALLLMRRKQS